MAGGKADSAPDALIIRGALGKQAVLALASAADFKRACQFIGAQLLSAALGTSGLAGT